MRKSAGGKFEMRESPAECGSLPQNAGGLATLVSIYLNNG